jgi:hypothetical protein
MDEGAIRCEECQRDVDEFTAIKERWGYWSDGCGDLLAYCPDCARRESRSALPRAGDRLPLSVTAPVARILRLDPPAVVGSVAARAPLRDDAFESELSQTGLKSAWPQALADQTGPCLCGLTRCCEQESIIRGGRRDMGRWGRKGWISPSRVDARHKDKPVADTLRA